MKQIVYAVQYLAASAIVGVLYGAVAGSAFGTVIAPIVGTMFGFVFGAIGGLVFGVIGSATGGLAGWTLAGFVGGLVSSSILNTGRPADAWSLAPAFILATVGAFIAVGLAGEKTKLPLIGWLQNLHERAEFLQGIRMMRLILALLAIIWSATILHERITAPLRPGGLIGGSSND